MRNTITFVIVTVHFGCLAMLYWHRPSYKPLCRRLVVSESKTVKLMPQPAVARTYSSPIAKPICLKPKVQPKPAAKAKPTAKPKPAAKPVRKKTEPLAVQKLIRKLQESIAKIEKKVDKSSLEVPTLTPMQAVTKEEEKTYQEKLIQRLHEALALPDIGEVTVEITLNSFGRVQFVRVLAAESATNTDYLERHLLHVIFPPLEGADAKQTQKKFMVTFYNEI